ncbi:hypothetical protein Dvina_38330 [Dactylosporangium vinaceum]|uniref:Uncharacterized protein n=1 Tax=Dactylosporangium vinaceum TaxID=53362 RepID=A0ABV5ML30_9ACTN|nr:hypothetical protein [Dactylosporangium vinaceum]UAB94010.1 hypothetical protein Dvina_38330 [Dactylosporangium vinaceum]
MPEPELIDALCDVTSATVRYDVRDNQGRTMDTLKVIADPAGGYLAVYHCGVGDSRFEVHVATSPDLAEWTWRARLDGFASQPTIVAMPDGGFLVAVEAGGAGTPPWLRLLDYTSRADLLAGRALRLFDAPHTQVPKRRHAEGTPNIYAVSADRSHIDVGFHYWRRGKVDRQARGVLTGFADWSARPEPRLDAALEWWGVRGNIGGRDAFTWKGRDYLLIEGQTEPGGWHTWRTYLYDVAAEQAWPLPIRTHGGSAAIANPAVTLLDGPSGRPELVVTAYLFHVGAAPGEGGPLQYHRSIRA